MKLSSLALACAAFVAAPPVSAMTYGWRAVADHIVIDPLAKSN